jgi:multidrug efflux pump subunit AcrA (membrane-fusion protein)
MIKLSLHTRSAGLSDHSSLPRRAFTLALGMVLFAGFFHSSRQAVPARAADLPSASPQVQKEDSLVLEGRLEPNSFAQLTVSVPALVDQVFVEEGDQVEAGTVVLRLDGYEKLQAEVNAADLEKLLAQQTLDDLNRLSEIKLAEATLALRLAEQDRDLAKDLLASLQRQREPQAIDQAYANMLLAKERLAKVKEDYRKAEQKFANHKNPIWMFVNRHRFKLLLNQMGKVVAYYENRYTDAKEKYEDRTAPPDAIDLALAEASLAEVEARLSQAEREVEKWRNGPDPDALESAQARLRAADARLTAAQTAAANVELTAPISGEVVAVDAKAGEWVTPGQPLVTIADLSQWIVVTEDLGEDSVSEIEAGLPVNLKLDAYPDLVLHGMVESVSQYAEEEDGDVYYQAKIAVQEPPDFLRWGMTARISLADK